MELTLTPFAVGPYNDLRLSTCCSKVVVFAVSPNHVEISNHFHFHPTQKLIGSEDSGTVSRCLLKSNGPQFSFEALRNILQSSINALVNASRTVENDFDEKYNVPELTHVLVNTSCLHLHRFFVTNLSLETNVVLTGVHGLTWRLTLQMFAYILVSFSRCNTWK